MSLLLAAVAAGLVGTGVYLLLQRRLTRLIIGLGLVSHGVNLVILLAGGGGGLAPFAGRGDADDMADPLPQALVLTAIVITFGVTAFLLALAYRSWQLTRDDEVEDDLEDRLIARLGGLHEDLADEEVASSQRRAEEAGPS